MKHRLLLIPELIFSLLVTILVLFSIPIMHLLRKNKAFHFERTI